MLSSQGDVDFKAEMSRKSRLGSKKYSMYEEKISLSRDEKARKSLKAGTRKQKISSK